jgi:hypothetical protein
VHAITAENEKIKKLLLEYQNNTALIEAQEELR